MLADHPNPCVFVWFVCKYPRSASLSLASISRQNDSRASCVVGICKLLLREITDDVSPLCFRLCLIWLGGCGHVLSIQGRGGVANWNPGLDLGPLMSKHTVAAALAVAPSRRLALKPAFVLCFVYLAASRRQYYSNTS